MNRRNRARFKTDMTARVTCPELGSGPIKGRLADLSVHGISLILKRELPVGARVKVEWGSATYEGELIHCRARGDEFIAGLKVDDPVYATTRIPRPD